MPRGDPRVMISFLLAPKQKDWINGLAEPDHTRTDVIRAALAIAKNHEPELKMMLKEMKEQG